MSPNEQEPAAWLSTDNNYKWRQIQRETSTHFIVLNENVQKTLVSKTEKGLVTRTQKEHQSILRAATDLRDAYDRVRYFCENEEEELRYDGTISLDEVVDSRTRFREFLKQQLLVLGKSHER